MRKEVFNMYLLLKFVDCLNCCQWGEEKKTICSNSSSESFCDNKSFGQIPIFFQGRPCIEQYLLKHDFNMAITQRIRDIPFKCGKQTNTCQFPLFLYCCIECWWRGSVCAHEVSFWFMIMINIESWCKLIFSFIGVF